MLRPFPLDSFCRGLGEIKFVVLIVVPITLNPLKVDFQGTAAANIGCDRIKGVGRAAGAVNGIGHGGNSKDGLRLAAFRGDTAYHNGS